MSVSSMRTWPTSSLIRCRCCSKTNLWKISSVLILLRHSNRPHLSNGMFLKHFPALYKSDFIRIVEKLVEQKEFSKVRAFLNQDSTLKEFLTEEIMKTKDKLKELSSAIELLYFIQWFTTRQSTARVSWHELYILAMSNKIVTSSLLEDSLSAIRTLESSSLGELLPKAILIISNRSLESIYSELKKLITALPANASLKSANDTSQFNLRTTVVAQKVTISKLAAETSPAEATYTKIVEGTITVLSQIFEHSFVNPSELLLSEAFIYDGKGPCREVFLPRPRFAVERALSSPHDYLNCECCGTAEEGLSASQPSISIMYRLYLESGSVLNMADLWSAFWTIVQSEDGSENEEEQEKAL